MYTRKEWQNDKYYTMERKNEKMKDKKDIMGDINDDWKNETTTAIK